MTEERTVARLRPFQTTVFAQMSALALAHDAINLGQGFPDTDGPAAMLARAQEAIGSGANQYPPGDGIPDLRAAISERIAADYSLSYDPDGEVLVTVGASEALAAAVLGTIEPGDEVIVIEPFFDLYAAAIAMAGATRVPVPLTATESTSEFVAGSDSEAATGSGALALDPQRLRAAITERTRAIIINFPHNPTGTLPAPGPDGTLAAIAQIAIAHDLLVISDEVYEYLIFDGATHSSIASLPGMRERTLRISSAAKTFNVTGWKVGWVTAPRELITAVRSAKQWLSFVGSGPFQPAVALALRDEMDWVRGSVATLQAARDQLSAALVAAGLPIIASPATYFVCADVRPLGFGDATAFCLRLPELVGVAAVPVSALADDKARWDPYARFAFSKRPEVLAEAAIRLGRLIPH